MENTFNLYPDENKTKEANKEIKELIDDFIKNYKKLQTKHIHVGAADTASRETVMYYIEDRIWQRLMLKKKKY